ncbi:hypothetical protein HMPREF1250_1018 [Megasphaera vaginalis (ex Srinivasan et al. 2021)]|uniref:Uncharacterized protein n=1 Tax=Megasphaera vaginalis (ex Srinivasan et al. 2021) TaxID=1111454 RepID=U7ULS5_9FIRM|nr:hypothetical protein HMPREF1250_1018 [Megasphaera vaginalis (ex Srinivasan et al. 2021)]
MPANLPQGAPVVALYGVDKDTGNNVEYREKEKSGIGSCIRLAARRVQI